MKNEVKLQTPAKDFRLLQYFPQYFISTTPLAIRTRDMHIHCNVMSATLRTQCSGRVLSLKKTRVLTLGLVLTGPLNIDIVACLTSNSIIVIWMYTTSADDTADFNTRFIYIRSLLTQT
jgi:hypothetical protein